MADSQLQIQIIDVHNTLFRRIIALSAYIRPTIIIPPYPWDALAICEVPDKANRTCCGLTRQGRPCKLSVRKDVHQMGFRNFNDLSCDLFDLHLLHTRLQDIVPHFLCAPWHRRLQVDNVRER